MVRSSQAAADSTLPSMLLSALNLLGFASKQIGLDKSWPDTGPEFPSCPTCGKSMDHWDLSTSSTAATPASPTPQPVSSSAPTMNGICGLSSSDAFAYYDPASSSLKTSQATLFEDSSEQSLTLPASGSLFAGVCYEQQTWVPLISETDSSLSPTTRLASVERLFPTPTTQDAFNSLGKAQEERHTPPLNTVVRFLPTPSANDATGGKNEEVRGGGSGLRGVDKLLPTPTHTRPDGGSRNLPGSKAHVGVSLMDAIRFGDSKTPRTPGAFTGPPSDDGKPSPEPEHPNQLMIEDD